jgi:hypothetical protein
MPNELVPEDDLPTSNLEQNVVPADDLPEPVKKKKSQS